MSPDADFRRALPSPSVLSTMEDYVFSISGEYLKVNHLDELERDLVAIDLAGEDN